MDRGNIVKWLLFGLAIFLFIQIGLPKIMGKGGAGDKQPLTINDSTAAVERAPEQSCAIEGKRFRADFSTRGGSLRHFVLTDPKYVTTEDHSKPIDLVTTSLESREPLRTDLRGFDGTQQVGFDDLDWKLEKSDGRSCTFSRVDESSQLTKTIAATDKPFELDVTVEVKNLAPDTRTHRLAIEETSWRTKKETEGSLGRQSEHVTETLVATTQKVHRYGPGDFRPEDFKDAEFTGEKWRRPAGDARFVATSSSYFTSALRPEAGAAAPHGEAQIEEYWDVARFPDKTKDPQYGHVYRSRLAYPDKQLKPGESASYHVVSYMGPKERELLGAVGFSDVINLGWFAPIGKLLVSYVSWLERLVGSWGWAIVLLTISVKLLLFPLSLSQIKNSIAMQRLKPEMDALNAKYKDDATQRGLALQELWRKNGVSNPVTGCLPVLLQMPVWFALYTALQTAVELYHTPFGPFIPDLSSPGKYFIIPLVLGASSFFQQKMMPTQGDPQQQKMMLYMMPGIFTVMMLFLPAGLGVYMLTNTWLGIAQQTLVARYQKAKGGGPGSGIEVKVKDERDAPSSKKIASGKLTPALGKGNARARG